jgi:hypothetical protein
MSGSVLGQLHKLFFKELEKKKRHDLIFLLLIFAFGIVSSLSAELSFLRLCLLMGRFDSYFYFSIIALAFLVTFASYGSYVIIKLLLNKKE